MLRSSSSTLFRPILCHWLNHFLIKLASCSSPTLTRYNFVLFIFLHVLVSPKILRLNLDFSVTSASSQNPRCLSKCLCDNALFWRFFIVASCILSSMNCVSLLVLVCWCKLLTLRVVLHFLWRVILLIVLLILRFSVSSTEKLLSTSSWLGSPCQIF